MDNFSLFMIIMDTYKPEDKEYLYSSYRLNFFILYLLLVKQMPQPVCVNQEITVENQFFSFIIWFAESKLRNSGHQGRDQNPLPSESCF